MEGELTDRGSLGRQCSTPRLSIVSTLFNSLDTAIPFIRSCKRAVDSAGIADWELILINDGCSDGTIDMLRAELPMGGNIAIVDLAVNAGHHAALMYGLQRASGDLIFMLDSDLEDDPNWLGDFLDQLELHGADLVYGFQSERSGDLHRRMSGWLAWRAIKLVGGLDVPANVVTARLMTRRFADSLLLFRERNVNIGGLCAAIGFNQVSVPVVKPFKGSSSYSTTKRLWHLLNGLTDFSTRSLIGIFFIGLAIFILALIYVLGVVIAAIWVNEPPSGWTSIIASVWLLGGLTITILGVVALYLAKVLDEVKSRPRVIVREEFNR